MNYYTKPNHEEILRLWEEMGWEQRNREREMGEIPEGASPKMEDWTPKPWLLRDKDSGRTVALPGRGWDTLEEVLITMEGEFNTDNPDILGYVITFGDEGEQVEFDNEMLTRRADFEKNCSCHICPPCSNCIEHSELFPETC